MHVLILKSMKFDLYNKLVGALLILSIPENYTNTV